MIIYCLIGILIIDLFLYFLRERKYLKIIKDLTDKLMSRDFTDYAMGKALKKDDKVVETKDRSDVKEMLIEKAKTESRKLKDVESEFNKKIRDMII